MLNDFKTDLKEYYKKYNVSLKTKLKTEYFWGRHFADINSYLYQNLSEEDKDTLIRFFLKRFCATDTVNASEKEEIDNAFNEAIKVCDDVNSASEEIETRAKFSFRGRNMTFYSPKVNYEGSGLEERLMNYYTITHSFFLVEYEKEGYNPLDGETIIDCGAADGDTALMFNTLYPNSFIHSFEFSEKPFEYLERNIKVNNASNIIANKEFLYAKSGDFYIDDNYAIIENGKCSENDSLDEIHTLSIDDYVKKNGLKNVGLIKFDIEGGEQKALQGAIRTIQEQKPLLHIPIYHLIDDMYKIPEFLSKLNLPMEMSIKWTEKLVWGMDCVLFIRFK